MKKDLVLMVAIVILPTVFAMTMVAQWIGTGSIDMALFAINYVVGIGLATSTFHFLPTDRVAKWLINKAKVDPKSAKFTMAMNGVINLAFSVVVGLGVTFLNVGVFAKEPMNVVFMAFIKTAIPLYLVSFFVSSYFLKYYVSALNQK